MTLPPTRRRRAARHLLPGSLLVALLAGCSGPAALDPPDPPEDATGICRSLVTALPDSVDGHDRRDTDPPSPYTAAWGDPAITLACGVPQPDGLGPASQCFEVNGVGWYADDTDAGVRFTTIGRDAFVQVVVPAAYAPEANPLVDLATPIKDEVPLNDPCV